MFVFEDLIKRYPLHVRNHYLLSGGFLLAVGIVGITFRQEPIIIYLALLGSLMSGLIARSFLLQIDYTGGVRPKHFVVGLLAVLVSAILLAWTYKSAVALAEPQFKRIVLPFILANLCLTYLPFLIVHGVKRSLNQPLF